MTRSTNRRAAAWLAGAVAGAGLLLSGCSTGQIAETALKEASVQGANADAALLDGGQVIGSVAVREVLIPYPGPEGYERGKQAPVEARIFNDTPQDVVVRVSAARPDEGSNQAVQAQSVVLMGVEPSAAPSTAEPVVSPTGSPAGSPSSAPTTPIEPEGAPAFLEIAAGSFVVLTVESETYLRLDGLADRLRGGMSVPLLFEFNNGLELRVDAPVTAPVTPAPRATADIEEQGEGH